MNNSRAKFGEIDMLEGDALACAENGVPELEFICSLCPVVGFGYIVVGLWGIYLSFNILKAADGNAFRRFTSVTGMTKATQAVNPVSNGERPSRAQTKKRFRGAQVQFVFGLCFILGGLGMVFMAGSRYPTDDYRGLLGDAFGICNSCVHWYLALMQVEGSNWVNTLLELPGARDRARQRRPTFVQYVGLFLNWIQSPPLSPLFAILLWATLPLKLLSRGRVYWISYGFISLFGIRAFVSIATKRLRTIKRVAAIVRSKTNASDNMEATSKRSGFVRGKFVALLFDLCAVFVGSVLFSGLFVMTGGVFRSSHFVVYLTLLSIPPLVLGGLFVSGAHRKAKAKAKALNAQQRALDSTKPAGEDASSLASGLSMVSQSAF